MPSAGAIVRASDNLSFVTKADSTADITLGAAADVTGATITFTTVNANTQVHVTASFDIRTAAWTSSGWCAGYLNVDGANQTEPAYFAPSAANQWATVAQSWDIVLATPGSHTLKLQGQKGSGTHTTTMAHPATCLTAFVNDRA